MGSCRPLVCGSDSGDEAADFFGVLDSADRSAVRSIGLNAGTHVNGQRKTARANLLDAIGHVYRRESTRQNEVSVDAWWQP
jgi:hypothetical protein